jgi:hypothetical protein
LLLLTILAVTILGQKSDVRDHLTEQEVDLVRSNQEIDLRVEVFMKAADRRLLASQRTRRRSRRRKRRRYGRPLPTGTALQLLQDYKRILEELEEKLDDASSNRGTAKTRR